MIITIVPEHEVASWALRICVCREGHLYHYALAAHAIALELLSWELSATRQEPRA